MYGKLFKKILAISVVAVALFGYSVEAGKGPVLPAMQYAEEAGGNVVLYYDVDLDSASVPAASDYVVTVSGQVVSVTSVSVNAFRNVILTLSSDPTLLDTVTVDYTPGATPIQNLVGDDAVALVSAPVSIRNCGSFDARTNPTQVVGVGNKIYVFSGATNAGYISVLDKSNNNALIGTISAGPVTVAPIVVGTDIYLLGDLHSKVYVLDTVTDTVTTITTDDTPIFAELVGTKLYVILRASAGFSIIDTDTKTITSTVTGLSDPRAGVRVGSKIYVIGTIGTVDYIDLNTDTVTNTHTFPHSLVHVSAVGAKLYIISGGTNDIYFYDTATDIVTGSVTYGPNMGTAPFIKSLAVGTDIYFIDNASNSAAILDTTTDTFISTLSVGLAPDKLVLIGSDVYVMNNHDTSVSVISTTSKTVTHTITSGDQPYTAYLSGSDVYVTNYGEHSVSVFDATTKNRVMCYECVYIADEGGAVSGATHQLLRTGQNPTAVTAIPNTGYTFTRWSDLVTSPTRSDTGLNTTLIVNAEFSPIPAPVKSSSARVIGGNAFAGSLVQAGSADRGSVVSQNTNTCETFGATTLVRAGTRGEPGVGVQKAVNQMKAVTLNLGTDGIIGPKSVIGIKRAQSMLGTKSDGLWGKNTQALYEAWVVNNCK
jgi:YVTN family beta-propeller protein